MRLKLRGGPAVFVSSRDAVAMLALQQRVLKAIELDCCCACATL